MAIVGAGYTGLWTAYYLAALDPSLRIVVLERQIAGYGASGRNGGWCSALLPSSLPALARAARAGRRDRVPAGDERARSTRSGRVAAAEGIDCHYAKGGTVVVARIAGAAGAGRGRGRGVAAAFGLDLVAAVRGRGVGAAAGRPAVLGGTYTPHCAAIHPARLVRGLAAAVERRGVAIYERTPVTALRPGAAVTPAGTVRAPIVVRATEGYTPALPGYRRAVAPVYSLMVATPPLPPSVWDTIGLAARETFTDYRHLIIYGQRTADDRLAFGGRGAPYHFGSSVRPAYDREPRGLR